MLLTLPRLLLRFRFRFQIPDSLIFHTLGNECYRGFSRQRKALSDSSMELRFCYSLFSFFLHTSRVYLNNTRALSVVKLLRLDLRRNVRILTEATICKFSSITIISVLVLVKFSYCFCSCCLRGPLLVLLTCQNHDSQIKALCMAQDNFCDRVRNCD